MYNLLVFPCGSEVSLEVHRSLRYSTHITLYGANSIDDHGKYVYENYIDDLPFIDDPTLIPKLKEVVRIYKIDAIYPGTDKATVILKSNESILGCKVIGSNLSVSEICLSKRKTYQLLREIIRVPTEYSSLEEVKSYPVFFKPEVGYGSRGVYKARDRKSAEQFIAENCSSKDGIMLLEYLPGEEYTVDCFTDRFRNLLFCAPRKRNRISNGISVNTSPIHDESNEFSKIARLINDQMHFRGAWFYQVKRNINQELVLMEIASRIGGSSGLNRNMGVNFALLSVFDAFDINVSIILNNYNIELDRALSNSYRIHLEYDNIYVDFDDCLIIKDKVNEKLITFLFQAINARKKIILLTKHAQNISASLLKYRLSHLFDEVIQIDPSDEKHKYVNLEKSIFIDDSYHERKEMRLNRGLPVFSPDMIESLLKS